MNIQHPLTMRIIVLALGILLVCPSSFGAEKRFHVTAVDHDGTPLQDIVVGVRSLGNGAAKVTDAQGETTITMDIEDGIHLAVVWVSALSLLTDASEGERARLGRRALSLPSTRPIEHLVRVTTGVNDYTVELRYRALRQVHGIITEQGNQPPRLWENYTPISYASGQSKQDGSFILYEPVATYLIIAMSPHDDSIPGMDIITRILASQIDQNGDMGTIDVDPTIAATGGVTFHLTNGPEAWSNVQAVFEPSFWGLSLVSSDGKTVMSFFSQSDDRLANEPAVMPVGTYYVVPGGIFCWTWTQRRIVEACLNGVDLSQSNIPRVVVTEGMNANIDFDPVAAELAIQEFFLPPE